MVLTMSIGIPLCFLLQKGQKFAANTENKRLLEAVASNPNNVHEEDWKRFYAPHFVEIIFQSQGGPAARKNWRWISLPEQTAFGSGDLETEQRPRDRRTDNGGRPHVDDSAAEAFD